MPDMRFAPPNPLRIADRASGLNALSIRSHNERLVLSLLLQNEMTTRLEIGEKTGLSAQTISVIVRSLEQENLVIRGEAQRGRVGPPTTPLLLNPEGAYSVGVSIGHSRTHIVLVDFVGNVKYRKTLSHEAGDLGNTESIVSEIRGAIASLSPMQRPRVAGIGLGLPAHLNDDERQHDGLHQLLEEKFQLPVFVQNDIAAAAGGESLFGSARRLPDFLFFYLGARVHSRLILNHQIYNGNSPLSHDVGVLDLEHDLASDLDRKSLWSYDDDWKHLSESIVPWTDRCAETLVRSVEALSEFVDIRTVVLSSFVPTWISQQLCSTIEKREPHLKAILGKTSPLPKAVGAAGLSFSSRFMVDG
jgi:hypothetical protein